ncbi:Gfo/Idh/MocA family protein [uncultured Amnibacterium sp.]|uniref:Gfo/Idh/MocA family protein n=1 Tax=uncultured Amnibacterium sp. TaxID=1631851 RepID=UPI0035CBD115
MVQHAMRVGFVGGGYRLAPYLAAIRALPEEFEAVGAVVRTDASAERLTAEGVPASTSIDAFLAGGPFDFVLLSVPWPQILPLAGRLLEAGHAVLSETPIAERTELVGPFLERYGADARLQSAEQYRFQPMHAARIAVARSGLIGEPVSVTASFAHDYHAMSVVRAALGIGFEPVRVTATAFNDRGVQPLGREGWSEQLGVEAFSRTVASLVWQDRSVSAVYDFTGEQYFSPIRSRRMAVRGTHGELAEDLVTAIRQPGEPFSMPLVRNATGIDGDLDGYHLRDVRVGETVLWRSRFGTARLADDELAVATVLRSMATYVADGTPFYGIADAAADQYLDELIHRSASEGRTVTSAPQAWSSLPSVLA